MLEPRDDREQTGSREVEEEGPAFMRPVGFPKAGGLCDKQCAWDHRLQEEEGGAGLIGGGLGELPGAERLGWPLRSVLSWAEGARPKHSLSPHPSATAVCR